MNMLKTERLLPRWPSHKPACQERNSTTCSTGPFTEINVTIAEENWDTLRYQRRTRENAPPPSRRPTAALLYSYVEADVSIEGVTYKNVGIRKRTRLAGHHPPIAQGSSTTTRKVKPAACGT